MTPRSALGLAALDDLTTTELHRLSERVYVRDAELAEVRAALALARAELTDARKQLVTARAAADRDWLTGLYSRAWLARTWRHLGRVEVLVVDVDRFKEINDVHGHVTGDEVLQAFAARLMAGAEVAGVRLGGDEVVVIAPPRLGYAARLGRTVTVTVDGQCGCEVAASASVGALLVDTSRTALAEALAAGDAAMYAAKRAAAANRRERRQP